MHTYLNQRKRIYCTKFNFNRLGDAVQYVKNIPLKIKIK